MPTPAAASSLDSRDLLPVFNALPGAYMLLSPELLIEAASDEYLAATLTTRAQLVGQFLFDAFPDNPAAPEAHATRNLRASLAQVLATGQPHQMAPQHYDVPDPAHPSHFVERHWLCTNRPVRDANDQVIYLLHTAVDITDQHLADRLLRETQAAEQAARAEAELQRERFYEVLMTLPALIATYHGPTHVYNFVNTAYQRYFPTHALPGRSLRDVLPETEAQGVLAMMDRVYQTGESSYQQELEVWLDFEGNGQPRQLFLSLLFHPLRNAQGQVDGLLDFSYDVTEQVHARQQVEQLNQELEARVLARTREAEAAQADAECQRARLESVFLRAPAAIAVYSGPDFVFELVNPVYQALLPGRPLLGLSVRDAFPEVTELPVFDTLQRVYETGITHHEQDQLIPVPGPDGTLENRYFNFTLQARYDEQHRVDGVIGFGFEVTAQVAARRQAEEGERRLQLLTDALPVLISYLDPTFTYRFVNQAYQTWFYKTPADIVGRTALELVGPAAYAQAAPNLARALAGERVEWQATMPYRPDFTRHVRGTFVPDIKNGQVLGIYSLLSDVSELVEARHEAEASTRQALALAQALSQTNAQLTRTNVDLDNFIYTASHDLRAPITNIEGLLLVLRKQLPASASQSLVPQLLDMMQGAVERFQITIAQLTDVARLQQAHDQPVELVAVAEVVEAVHLDLAPQLAQAAAQLVVEVAPDLRVSFAPKNLRSVLYNLLSNAIKYQYPGRPPVIRLRAERHEQALVLTVQDNGLGLSNDQQGQLFGLFQRLHTHVEGTGVGLYMVKRMVENAGGTITVQSQPEIGTTFSIHLPA